MDLNRLKTFLKVVQYGSFKKVADDQLQSQRAVSKQISLLEEELGTQLFIRNANKITLTKQGKFFYASAQDIVNNYNAALTQLKELDYTSTNHLSCGYFSAFEKPLLQNALLKLNHEATQLNVTQESNEHLYNGVRDGRLDLALSINYGIDPLPNDSNLKSISIFKNQMVIGVSKANPISQKPTLTEWDLEDQNILYYSPESSTFLLESFLTNVSFLHQDEKIQRVATMEQMNLLVSLNQALAFYPNGLLQSLAKETEIKFLPLNINPEPNYEIVIIYNPENKNPLLTELIKNFQKS